MTDRVPGAPGRCKAVVTAEELQKMQSGNEFAITLRRDDQPIQEGTPYSKAAVLPDAVAAKLCPGAVDPTPGDAFTALQTQKADTVRHASGSNIILHDAAHTPLMGLKIYGGYNGESLVGESGSVTVNVMGKNLYDKATYPLTAKRWVNRFNGEIVEDVDMACTLGYIPISHLQGKTITLNHIPSGGSPGMAFYDANKKYISGHKGKGVTVPNNAEYMRFCVDDAYADGEDVQWEIGTQATAYEPYKEPQTLTVPTPFVLDSLDNGMGGSVEDQIDFAKGVYIRRTEDGFIMDTPEETPLPDDVLEAYAKLHTYSPTTSISNDAGANMEVTYYTPTTAVQMVHNPADNGKTFTIDEHGCVTLVKDNPEIASGETTIDGVKWYYRKWNNGYAEFWSSVVPLGYEGSRILSRWTALPFPVWEKVISITVPEAESSYLLQEPYVLSYLEIDGGNVVKICAIADTGIFTEADHINVSIRITGLWKAD